MKKEEISSGEVLMQPIIDAVRDVPLAEKPAAARVAFQNLLQTNRQSALQILRYTGCDPGSAPDDAAIESAIAEYCARLTV